MRKDFKKVLCEEPRYQGWNNKGKALNKRKGYKKKLQRGMKGDYDEWSLPKKESMFGKRGRGDKGFGEHLGPLVRFLRKSVGRKWDDVYSEIREVCPNDNAVNAHIYQHLWGYVDRRTYYKDDGKLYAIGEWGWEHEVIDRGQDDSFYVDAKGILRRAPRRIRKKARKDNPDVFKHNGKIYVRKNNIWYKTALKPIRKPKKVEVEVTGYGGCVYKRTEYRYPAFTDVYLGVFSSGVSDGRRAVEECIQVYGKRVYCWQLKQISSREKKKLGLKK